jgi:hypothetical protein
VISPGGTVYWGNAGLTAGVWSSTTGSRDRINTAENVFVPSPTAGLWTVEVIGYVVADDTHVETPAVDADYGLVVSGGVGPAALATVVPVGSGCFGVALSTADRPIVGTSFELVTSNVPATTLLGLSILSFQGIAPPLDLTFLGMPGCELYQALDLLTAFATAGGAGAVSYGLPNDPSLAGVVLRCQSAVLAPGVNAFDFATSNGLVLTIGLN